MVELGTTISQITFCTFSYFSGLSDLRGFYFQEVARALLDSEGSNDVEDEETFEEESYTDENIYD